MDINSNLICSSVLPRKYSQLQYVDTFQRLIYLFNMYIDTSWPIF